MFVSIIKVLLVFKVWTLNSSVLGYLKWDLSKISGKKACRSTPLSIGSLYSIQAAGAGEYLYLSPLQTEL